MFFQSKMAGALNGRHADGFDRVGPDIHGLFQAPVDMTARFDFFEMLVIGTERAVFQRYAFFDQALQDGFEILRARSFPQKQMQTGFQLFDRLVGIDRFVITRNARQPIRHQITAMNAGRMPVDGPAFKRFQNFQHALISVQHIVKTHHFAQAKHLMIFHIRFHIPGHKIAGAVRFKTGGGNGRGHHHINIERRERGFFEHVVQPGFSAGIDDFMRVRHQHRRSPLQKRQRDAKGRSQRAFNMNMGIDQTRQNIRAVQIVLFLAGIRSDTRNFSVVDRNIFGYDRVGKDIDDVRVFQNQIAVFESSGFTYRFLHKFKIHKWIPSLSPDKETGSACFESSRPLQADPFFVDILSGDRILYFVFKAPISPACYGAALGIGLRKYTFVLHKIIRIWSRNYP